MHRSIFLSCKSHFNVGFVFINTTSPYIQLQSNYNIFKFNLRNCLMSILEAGQHSTELGASCYCL